MWRYNSLFTQSPKIHAKDMGNPETLFHVDLPHDAKCSLANVETDNCSWLALSSDSRSVRVFCDEAFQGSLSFGEDVACVDLVEISRASEIWAPCLVVVGELGSIWAFILKKREIVGTQLKSRKRKKDDNASKETWNRTSLTSGITNTMHTRKNKLPRVEPIALFSNPMPNPPIHLNADNAMSLKLMEHVAPSFGVLVACDILKYGEEIRLKGAMQMDGGNIQQLNIAAFDSAFNLNEENGEVVVSTTAQAWSLCRRIFDSRITAGLLLNRGVGNEGSGVKYHANVDDEFFNALCGSVITETDMETGWKLARSCLLVALESGRICVVPFNCVLGIEKIKNRGLFDMHEQVVALVHGSLSSENHFVLMLSASGRAICMSPASNSSLSGKGESNPVINPMHVDMRHFCPNNGYSLAKLHICEWTLSTPINHITLQGSILAYLSDSSVFACNLMDRESREAQQGHSKFVEHLDCVKIDVGSRIVSFTFRQDLRLVTLSHSGQVVVHAPLSVNFDLEFGWELGIRVNASGFWMEDLMASIEEYSKQSESLRSKILQADGILSELASDLPIMAKQGIKCEITPNPDLFTYSTNLAVPSKLGLTICIRNESKNVLKGNWSGVVVFQEGMTDSVECQWQEGFSIGCLTGGGNFVKGFCIEANWKGKGRVMVMIVQVCKSEQKEVPVVACIASKWLDCLDFPISNNMLHARDGHPTSSIRHQEKAVLNINILSTAAPPQPVEVVSEIVGFGNEDSMQRIMCKGNQLCFGVFVGKTACPVCVQCSMKPGDSSKELKLWQLEVVIQSTTRKVVNGVRDSVVRRLRCFRQHQGKRLSGGWRLECLSDMGEASLSGILASLPTGDIRATTDMVEDVLRAFRKLKLNADRQNGDELFRDLTEKFKMTEDHLARAWEEVSGISWRVDECNQ